MMNKLILSLLLITLVSCCETSVVKHETSQVTSIKVYNSLEDVVKTNYSGGNYWKTGAEVIVPHGMYQVGDTIKFYK